MNKKLVKTGLSTLVLCMPLLGLSAHASMITKSSLDKESGKVTVTVHNDKQGKLPPAQLGIKPAAVNSTIYQSTGRSRIDESLTLYNYSKEAKKIKLSLIDIGTDRQPIIPSEDTLTPWTLISPTNFTIPVDGYQVIRVSIRTPPEFPKGKYTSVLMIEQQVENQITYSEDGEAVKLKMGSRYGMPLHITVE